MSNVSGGEQLTDLQKLKIYQLLSGSEGRVAVEPRPFKTFRKCWVYKLGNSTDVQALCYSPLFPKSIAPAALASLSSGCI